MKLYHGTSEYFLKGIREKGLCPPRLGEKGGEFFEPEHEDTIYFTKRLVDAWAVGGTTAVFEVDVRDLKPPDFKVLERRHEVAVRATRCIPPEEIKRIFHRPRWSE